MKIKFFLIFAFVLFIFSVPRADAATGLRTVEYFIYSSAAQLGASAWANQTFSIGIPDTGFKIVNAYFDIYSSYEAAGTTDASLIVALNSTTMRTVYMEAQTEAYLAHIVANATNQFYTSLGSSSTDWTFGIKNGAANAAGGISAKLVVTYEYTEPPKTKTVKFYVNNSLGAVAASGWNNQTFPVTLAGTNINVKSAWFEITHMNPGAADTTPAVYLNNTLVGSYTEGGTAPSYGMILLANATATTTTPNGGIYGITDTTTRNYDFGLKCGAGDTCEGTGAVLFVTYASDTEAQLETVSYFLNSSAGASAANVAYNQSFSVKLSDTSPVVKSAYLVVRGLLPAVAGDVRMFINNTLLGKTAYVAPLELANFEIFHNATGSTANSLLYAINDNNQWDFNITLQCATNACHITSTELVITYGYSISTADSTPPQSFETGTNATAVAPSGEVLIYANWTDETALSWATLQTNETGTAQNYTASYAPISLSSTSSWSNFTWRNTSVAGGTEIQWKIFANDSSNNTNGTAGATFRIFQQVNQPVLQSLTINFQNKNLQSLFSIIRNAIATTLQINKASTFMKSVNNAITTNTAFTSLSTFLRTISQAVTQNAAYTTVSNFLRTISQIVAASFATQSIGAFFKTISNAITTNTVVGPISTLFKIISQAFAQNSAITTAKGTLISISQAITQNSAVQTAKGFLKTVSQAITPNSITTRVGSFLRPISQAIAQNAIAKSVSSIFKNISQAITQNSVTKVFTTFLKTISQAITQNSANQVLNSIFKTISQAITQNSATKSVQSIFKTISQAVTQNAATQTVVSFLRSISQAITENISFSRTASIFKSISQAFTQNSATQVFSTFLKSVSQAVTQNSAVTTIKGVLVTVSQAITQNAAFKTTLSIFKTISQAVTQNIVTQTITSIFKTISQAVTQSANVNIIKGFLKTVSQTFTQNSATQTVFSIFRSASQAVTQNAITKTVTSIFKTISQAVTQNAVAQAVQSIFKTISQAVTQNALVKSVASIFKTISNAISTNTATQLLGSIFRSVSQAITQATNVSNLFSILRNISQAITQNAVFKSTVGIFKIISQAVTQNAAAQAVQSIFKNISQALTQNSAYQSTASVLRTINQAITTNTALKAASSIFKLISQAITQNSVAKSISSLFKLISQAVTENLSISKASSFFRTVAQAVRPDARGLPNFFHRFYISVAQSITYHYELALGAFRAPPAPTGPTVAVIYNAGGGSYTPRITQEPTIVPAIVLKPPVSTSSLQFVKVPVVREVKAGDSILDGIILKNSGDAAIEEIETSVSGISPKWITIVPSSTDINVGERRTFALFMNIPKDASAGDYLVSVNFKASNINEMASFMLRVKGAAVFENITSAVGNVSTAVGNVTGIITPPTVAAKAVTSERTISIDTENQRTEITLNVKNGPEPQYNVLVTEKIKKEIANSTDLLDFGGQDVEIIQADPIVRWKIKELAPFETRNFSYSVKQVLPDYSALVYWTTEEIALSPGAVEGINILPLKPIELSGGRITPAPVIIENIGNKTRNISITMALPNGWSLVPTSYNYTLQINETKLFDFNILLPADIYPGYYVGKVYITVDGQAVIKEYEFAVLNNLELLVRPLVIVVVLFFGIGVVWIRLKIIELNGELEEIKSLTEVRRSKEEIEAQTQKVRKGLRDLELLYRDNVIDDYTYQEEKEKARKTMARLSKDLAFEQKRAKAEKPKKSGKVREVYGRAEKLEREAEELEIDYSKGIVRSEYYKKRKAEIAGETKKIKSALVGNKQVLEDIKKLLESRKSLLNGIKKLKDAYDEGFITREVYESGESDLKKRISAVNASLRKESGVVERSREKMIGSNLFLKILSDMKV